jgi:hypothetical protein
MTANNCWSLLVFALMASAGVMAQATRPQKGYWAKPTEAQIIGKTCSNSGHVAINVGAQDLQTLFYSGRIFASVRCADGLFYQGCADGSWDPTGGFVTFNILWQDHKGKLKSELGGDARAASCLKVTNLAIQ